MKSQPKIRPVLRTSTIVPLRSYGLGPTSSAGQPSNDVHPRSRQNLASTPAGSSEVVAARQLLARIRAQRAAALDTDNTKDPDR